MVCRAKAGTEERWCAALWYLRSSKYWVRHEFSCYLCNVGITFAFSPAALIMPARSHAEVIVVAVAARDKKKAETYAKRHGIPIVHDSYDGEYPQYEIDVLS
jgi:hypothetical protein